MRERLRLGVRLDEECGPLKRAIEHVAQLGFSAVELSADHRDVASANASESGRRHLARLVRNSGMKLVSIAAPIDLSRIDLIDDLDRVMSSVTDSLRMARDMESLLTTVSIAAHSTNSDSFQPRLVHAFSMLADGADRLSTTLALRSKILNAEHVSALLDQADCPFLRASFDPADSILSGGDPIEAFGQLAGHLALAYVSDAVGPQGERSGYRCPIGQGALDVDRYIGDMSACLLAASIMVHGPSPSRPYAQVSADVDRLQRTGLL